MIAVNALPLFEAEAKKRQIESKIGNQHANKTSSQKIDTLFIDTDQKLINNKNSSRATQQVAKQFSTNRQYVDDAKKLKGYPKSCVKVDY